MDIVRYIEGGKRAVVIARSLCLPPMTVWTIFKSDNDIRESIKNVTRFMAKRVRFPRSRQHDGEDVPIKGVFRAILFFDLGHIKCSLH